METVKSVMGLLTFNLIIFIALVIVIRIIEKLFNED